MRSIVQTNTTNMKQFVFLLLAAILLTTCQQRNKSLSKKMHGDYPKLWAQVDSLEQQAGLPKSALELVEQIYKQAIADESTEQRVRATVYKAKYKVQLEEDGLHEAIKDLEQEILIAQEPDRQILQSITASIYQAFYQNRQYEILNRKEVKGDQNTDTRTWSAAQFERRIAELYLASLEFAKTPLPYSKYGTLVVYDAEQNATAAEVWPTILDVLEQRALDYFSNSSSLLTTDYQTQFRLEDAAALAPVALFTKHRFTTTDTAALPYRALRIYQTVLARNLAENKIKSLIFNDLRRIDFANAQLQTDQAEKNELTLAAYDQLYKTYRKSNQTGYIAAAQARIYMQRGGLYEPSDSTTFRYKNDLVNAVEVLKSALKSDQDPQAATACRALLAQIEDVQLSPTTELPLLSNKTGLFGCSYRNIDQAHFRIIQWSESLAKEEGQLEEPLAQWKFLMRQPVVKTWSEKLLNPRDYRLHHTELEIPALPVGKYRMLSSSSSDFAYSSKTCSAVEVQVSDLQIAQYTHQNQMHWIAINRVTGKPVVNADVSVYAIFWDYQGEKRTLVTTGKTDAKGHFEYASQDINTQYKAEVTAQGETVSSHTTYPTPDYPRNPHAQMFFFTDRALYRPGQTIYFKGLAMRVHGDKQPEIITNQPVIVSLRNANYQEVSKLQLQTNAFGTVHGSFIAPTGVLTGNMQIVVENKGQGISGSIGVQVEEYKRPRFEVTFKVPAQTVVVGDQVTVIGTALNYAGNPTDGATVKYRVVRKTQFPFCGWWRYIPQIPDVIMASGEAVTNAEGKFEVKFTAGADKSVARHWQPLFTYEVQADVTDISGETRSGTASVSVGYHTIDVSSSLTEIADIDTLRKVTIKTTDLNGNAIPVAGEVRVQRLLNPTQNWHSRIWPEPDVWSLKEADYRAKHLAYAPPSELDPRKRALSEKAEVIAFHTDSTGIVLNLTEKAKLDAGMEYRITIVARDEKGRTTETVRFVKVIDGKNSQKTIAVLGEPWINSTTAQPGQQVQAWFGNGIGQTDWFILVERRRGLEKLQVLTTEAHLPKSVELPVTKEDHNSFYLTSFWLQHGFVHLKHFAVQVPDLSRELNISFETFRDKLSPGAKETWKLRISGRDKEKAAAEVVAALYDASLDQFIPHVWHLPPGKPDFYSQIFLQYLVGTGDARQFRDYDEQAAERAPYPANLNLFDFPFYRHVMYMDFEVHAAASEAAPPTPTAPDHANKRAKAKSDESSTGGAPTVLEKSAPAPGGMRTNLNETVFFFPQLTTDANGDILVQFTMNEALTRWKFLAFAHTKDLRTALANREVVTQKELMVLPNQPRFLRAGDRMSFSGKVSNLTTSPMQGTATLELFDALTMRPVSSEFGLAQQSVSFTAPAGQSAPIAFELKVPESPSTQTLVWRMRAQAGSWADGEENTLPIVQNRMLVTETLPLTVRGGQTKQFDFERLRQISGNTIAQHRYTVEFTSNPAWYAVRALPYLMEYPHECNEQIFSRMYANAIASTVANKYPVIRKVYDQWKANGALQSNLTKNQELKSALLQETPWVLEAQSEEQQQQQIALLFDLNRMADEQAKAISILSQRQNGEGAWSWFDGGRSDEFITRYITIGFRRLDKINALPKSTEVKQMQEKAIGYLDKKVAERYQKLLQEAKKNPKLLEEYQPDYSDIYHLYLHSFDPQGARGTAAEAIQFYLNRLPKCWVKQSLYAQALTAIILHRFGKTTEAQSIIASLKERAIISEELGMYWPYERGFYWYEMPVETQALMVEVMQEVAKDQTLANEIRIWLLKNKQTNHWKTTKETAEAVYAFLIGNETWVSATQPLTVEVGGKALQTNSAEAGAGYSKQAWNTTEIKSSLANIKVKNPNQTLAWGAAYWQYFEDLDKITGYNTAGLGIKKEVYKVQGEKLTAINTGNKLKPGDMLKVRIIITADRAYEYVHLKDMRAAGFEPVNVISGYRWSGSLGYYESTKDLASHFFIDYLPKGTHVFEYPLVVNHRGDFSNGITTIQCMYAPEFGGHSKGIRLSVE